MVYLDKKRSKDKKKPIEKTDKIHAHFEVYSPWEYRAAGIGGILLLSSLVAGLTCLAYFLLNSRDSSGFFVLPIILLFMILLFNWIVKLFRFNVGRKIVIDKNSLTVGGRSWDVMSLTKYVEVPISEDSKFSICTTHNRCTTHEYTVFDKSGKAVARFDWHYVNANLLKEWLQNGGSEKVCK